MFESTRTYDEMIVALGIGFEVIVLVEEDVLDPEDPLLVVEVETEPLEVEVDWVEVED